MAAGLAARLTAQEEQIRRLTQEMCELRDGLGGDLDIVGASPLLDTLRSDNEKLKYRLVHLRRGLQAELGLRGQTQVKNTTASETARQLLRGCITPGRGRGGGG